MKYIRCYASLGTKYYQQHTIRDGFLFHGILQDLNGEASIMEGWIYPLLLSLIGGPAAIIFRRWYSKKEDTPSKFKDAGTYVRDDSLYSYDEKEKDSTKP